MKNSKKYLAIALYVFFGFSFVLAVPPTVEQSIASFEGFLKSNNYFRSLFVDRNTGDKEITAKGLTNFVNFLKHEYEKFNDSSTCIYTMLKAFGIVICQVATETVDGSSFFNTSTTAVIINPKLFESFFKKYHLSVNDSVITKFFGLVSSYNDLKFDEFQKVETRQDFSLNFDFDLFVIKEKDLYNIVQKGFNSVKSLKDEEFLDEKKLKKDKKCEESEYRKIPIQCKLQVSKEQVVERAETSKSLLKDVSVQAQSPFSSNVGVQFPDIIQQPKFSFTPSAESQSSGTRHQFPFISFHNGGIQFPDIIQQPQSPGTYTQTLLNQSIHIQSQVSFTPSIGQPQNVSSTYRTPLNQLFPFEKKDSPVKKFDIPIPVIPIIPGKQQVTPRKGLKIKPFEDLPVQESEYVSPIVSIYPKLPFEYPANYIPIPYPNGNSPAWGRTETNNEKEIFHPGYPPCPKCGSYFSYIRCTSRDDRPQNKCKYDNRFFSNEFKQVSIEYSDRSKEFIDIKCPECFEKISVKTNCTKNKNKCLRCNRCFYVVRFNKEHADIINRNFLYHYLNIGKKIPNEFL